MCVSLQSQTINESGMKNNTIKLAILGSGNGTNAQQISEYFANSSDVEVACIIYNKRDAYIAERARNLGIEARYLQLKHHLLFHLFVVMMKLLESQSV